MGRLKKDWCRFWLSLAGPGTFGRMAARLACVGTSPYHGRAHLARWHPRGFVAPSAHVGHPGVVLSEGVYLGDGVVILAGDAEAGPIEIGAGVAIYGDTFIQSGKGGRLSIGAGTHIQPGCHLRAYVSGIEIGEKVEIAAGCAFYCFSHGVRPESLVMEQELESKGPIKVGDGAWLGHGVTVLEGVTIGAGAVIGAGSVVVKDIPANAIAVGVPAKVIKSRADLEPRGQG